MPLSKKELVFFWLLAFGVLAASVFSFISIAHAHQYWDGANCGPGKANPSSCVIPAWVKASCCGPSDAHQLRPDQVHRVDDDHYMVDGYNHLIPAGMAIPSQDGDYWIFYREDASGAQSSVYCFFVPMDF